MTNLGTTTDLATLADKDIIVISAPSGTGKTTLCTYVVQEHPTCALSISHTTRKRRGAERNGVDYYFIAEDKFQELIEADAFMEWAHVYKRYYYGTSRAHLGIIATNGHRPVLDIDVQGADRIRQVYPEATMILLIPPGFTELARRLKERKTDDDEEIKRRLSVAREEMLCYDRFKYVVVNDSLEKAEAALDAIILDKPEAKSYEAAAMRETVEAILKEV